MTSDQIVNRLLEDELDDFDTEDILRSVDYGIPVPDNPVHVDNLRTLSLLKRQNFQGTDAGLATSLLEYGLVWRELPDSWLFVYRGTDDRFHRQTIDKNVNLLREYDWVDWPEFLNSMGDGEAAHLPDISQADWFKNSLPWKIADLVNYHGVENVFGTDYAPGFEIVEEPSGQEDDGTGEAFIIVVRDNDGLWGQLRILAADRADAAAKATAELRRKVQRRETEVDLDTMRLEITPENEVEPEDDP